MKIISKPLRRPTVTKNEKALLIGFVCFSLLPIWRSGLRENMSLPAWLINHTVFGPPSEYIPEKYYLPEHPALIERELVGWMK